jgi:uncharacterized protein YaeQ
MALTSTMYSFEVELSDSDRDVYTSFKLNAALHPSETLEYMLLRVIGFCCEYEEGLVFSRGLGESEEPAIWAHHLDGKPKKWVEIGSPEADRVHKASKTGAAVAVYSHRLNAALLETYRKKKIHRGENIFIYGVPRKFLEELSGALDRRNELTVARSEGVLYLSIGGRDFSTSLEAQPLNLPQA